MIILHIVKMQNVDMSKYDVCFPEDFRGDLKEFILLPFIHFPYLQRGSALFLANSLALITSTTLRSILIIDHSGPLQQPLHALLYSFHVVKLVQKCIASYGDEKNASHRSRVLFYGIKCQQNRQQQSFM